jgi:ribosomal-protein-alanine N-acetyltransferase
MIILETERLLFRQHTMADMDTYCAMEMDSEVRRYVGGRLRTREEAEQRFMGLLTPVIDRLSIWATVYKPENKYIGRCGVYPHFNEESKPIAGEGSLGLYIASTHWGRGLATEAGQAFIEFGFNELQLDRIVTSIDTRNDASVQVIHKLGFELISTQTGPRSFYHFAIFNPSKI